MGELDEKLNAILGNQEAMSQIMALARSLDATNAPEQSGTENITTDIPPDDPVSGKFESILGEIDPGMIRLGMRALEEYQKGDDRKTALLSALRPFMREERCQRLDRAIQIARLSRGIRVVFDAMRGGESPHV